MSIDLKKVKSSNIKQAGYDEDTNTLAIEFSNGRTYHYKGVPKDDYERLINSDSPGKYFDRRLRKYMGEVQPEEKKK